MIRSMTGYGSARWKGEQGTVEAEVRAVNGRNLRVRASLPSAVGEQESAVREQVGSRLERGTVNVRVDVEETGQDAPELELDDSRVRAYLAGFRRLREEYDLPGQVDLPLLVRAGDLLRERVTAPAEWLEYDRVEALLEEALDQVVEMRREEGARLQEDLEARLYAIEEHLSRVEELAPRRLERERERLREAAEELVEDQEVDEDRVAREIALLADKWDIGEELSRARSHLEGFRELLAGDDAEPVGRRLNFLAQELHREINTTGAKGNDADISRHVVEMKNELEAIKEQVENVE